MNEEKRPSPVVETRDGGQLVMADVLLSRQKHTTETRQEQGKIAALLLPGAGNAVPLRRLAAMTGQDERAVRRAIHHERLAGVPIVSDNATGYWLADNAADVNRFCRSMRGRARQILAAADAIEAARDGREGRYEGEAKTWRYPLV